MNSIPTENPAAVLHRSLVLFRSQPRRTSNRDAWAVVFKVHPSETGLLIVGLARLIERSDQVQSLVAFATPSALALRWVDPVSESLAHSAELSQQATLAQKLLDETCMLSLEACASAIGRGDCAEPSANQVQLALQLTDELLMAISQADLPFEAYSLMMRHVLALQQALKLLPVVGMDGLYDAMLTAVEDLEHSVVRSQLSTPWYQKLRSVLATIAQTLTLGNEVVDEASKVIHALPPGSNPFSG